MECILKLDYELHHASFGNDAALLLLAQSGAVVPRVGHTCRRVCLMLDLRGYTRASVSTIVLAIGRSTARITRAAGVFALSRITMYIGVRIWYGKYRFEGGYLTWGSIEIIIVWASGETEPTTSTCRYRTTVFRPPHECVRARSHNRLPRLWAGRRRRRRLSEADARVAGDAQRPYLVVDGARVHSGRHVLLETELVLGGLAVHRIVEVHRRQVAVDAVPVQAEGQLREET